MGDKYGVKSDVFSLGVILYFILSGDLPFNSDENDLIVQKTIEGDYNMNGRSWDIISDQAKNLIQNMLEKDQTKRFSIE